MELAREREIAQRNAARRLRYLVVSLGIFLAVAIGLSALAFQQRGEAETQRLTAVANATEADRQRQAAVTNATEADKQRQEAQASFTRAEAQRIAGEANQLFLNQGNSEVAALLALRSIKLQYTPQGDQAITEAARTNLPLRRIDTGDLDIRVLTFAPDGIHALSGGSEDTVILWDITTGQQIREFKGHTNDVTDASFSPDMRSIATGSFDGQAIIWDIATGQPQHTFQLPNALRRTAFSPDGTRLLTVGGFSQVIQWDIAKESEILQFDSSDEDLLYADYSPDGKLIVAGGTSAVAWVFDAVTGVLVQEFKGHTDWIWKTRFSPDGTMILTCSDDRTIRLWDVATGKQLQVFRHATAVKDVEFTLGGKQVLSLSWDRTARLWDVTTGQEIQRLTAIKNSRPWDLAISPDGRTALTSEYGGFLIWDLSGAKLPMTLKGHTNPVTIVRASADGSLVMTASTDRDLRIWDAHTGKLIRTLTPEGAVGFLNADLSPDGQYAIASYFDRTVFLWKVASGELIARYQTRNWPNIAFARDSSRVYISDDRAEVYESATGKRVFGKGVQVSVPGPLAPSPDGQWLAQRGVVTIGLVVFNTRTGQLTRAYSETVNLREVFWDDALAFSPDSRSIAAGFGDGSVRIFSIEGGPGRVLVGHTEAVQGLAFSPDGEYLLSGSADKTARLWDVASGQEVGRFTTLAGINSVAFTGDGVQAIIGSDDDVARMWDIDLERTVNTLCNRLLRDFTPEERSRYGIPDDGPTCVRR